MIMLGLRLSCMIDISEEFSFHQASVATTLKSFTMSAVNDRLKLISQLQFVVPVWIRFHDS